MCVLYLGSFREIRADGETYLMVVKRMLPRWANSLPDGGFIEMQHLIGN
jgi:hypothetical protein